MTTEQRQALESRMDRYRRENPEEAARVDALFAPIEGELARLGDILESKKKALEQTETDC